jgi:hypothetical protein
VLTLISIVAGASGTMQVNIGAGKRGLGPLLAYTDIAMVGR